MRMPCLGGYFLAVGINWLGLLDYNVVILYGIKRNIDVRNRQEGNM
jgi:hypothetical protein